jgi:hypothetical protein
MSNEYYHKDMYDQPRYYTSPMILQQPGYVVNNQGYYQNGYNGYVDQIWNGYYQGQQGQQQPQGQVPTQQQSGQPGQPPLIPQSGQPLPQLLQSNPNVMQLPIHPNQQLHGQGPVGVQVQQQQVQQQQVQHHQQQQQQQQAQQQQVAAQQQAAAQQAAAQQHTAAQQQQQQQQQVAVAQQVAPTPPTSTIPPHIAAKDNIIYSNFPERLQQVLPTPPLSRAPTRPDITLNLAQKRVKRKSKFSKSQDDLIVSLKKKGKSWVEIAEISGVGSYLAARNRFQVIVGQQGNNNSSSWNLEDKVNLQNLLDVGEIEKWKFISIELNKATNKDFTDLECRELIKLMFWNNPGSFGVNEDTIKECLKEKKITEKAVEQRNQSVKKSDANEEKNSQQNFGLPSFREGYNYQKGYNY